MAMEVPEEQAVVVTHAGVPPGYGIVDCGATKSLGGTTALDLLMNKRHGKMEKKGSWWTPARMPDLPTSSVMAPGRES